VSATRDNQRRFNDARVAVCSKQADCSSATRSLEIEKEGRRDEVVGGLDTAVWWQMRDETDLKPLGCRIVDADLPRLRMRCV
jgi:hypothetical protein